MDKKNEEKKKNFFDSWKFIIILYLVILFLNAITSSGGSKSDRYDYDNFDYNNERQVEDILKRKPENDKSWFED